MGNSNSSHQQQQQQQQSLQWSQSLDGAPDSRNRMKSGYFPPRHYMMGHNHGGPPGAGAMMPPQKVLPTVNPAKDALRLKPTSNGAILHKGGTISGRKIQQLQELEEQQQQQQVNSQQAHQRKRHLSASSILNEGPDDFQRRSQRSISGHTINFDKNIGGQQGGSVANGRDYDSEPDIRDDSGRRHQHHESPERSVSPLPNSFTLIQESPAKKQIRTKKKYQAPPPPPVHSMPPQDHSTMASGFEFHDPHRLGTPTSSTHSAGKKKLQRLFKTKAQSKQIQREEELAAGHQHHHQQQQQQRILSESHSTSNGPSASPSQMQIPHVRITRNSVIRSSMDVADSPKTGRIDEGSSRRQSEIASAAAQQVAAMKKKPPAAPAPLTKEEDKRALKKSSTAITSAGGREVNEASSKSNNDVTDSSASAKKTFYFGMDSSTTTEMTFTQQAQSHRIAEDSLLEQVEDDGMKAKWHNNKQITRNNHNSSNDKNNKANVGQRSSSSHSQNQQIVEDELSKVMQLRGNKVENQPPPPPPPQPPPMSSTPVIKSHKIISQKSDSDSDGFNKNIRNNNHNNNHNSKAHRKVSRDSSSELSSSDVDIPILIRPTLPQRRLDLPRFSPSAAWRALDSPRASGRSLSSEDGFSYEDRIQRYTRPSAPPRNNNERSGDSGISAGDAGSPANAPPDHGRNSSCSFSISGQEMNFKSKLHSKIHSDSPGKGDQKCWTPEQDLDESSSEFEHDVDCGPSESPRGKIKNNTNVVSSSNVPIGLQTPPKFTTRSNLFSDESSSSGRLYTRSSKAANNLTVVDINNDPESKRVIHHRVIGKNPCSPNQQPFSLDTNWFLSRSEPNSLNVLGMNERNGGPKLSVAPEASDFLDKAFESSSRFSSHQEERRMNGYHVHNSSEVRSEIGYGPSSMNFCSHQQQQSQPPFYDDDSKANSLVLFRRPFAHIMYLPSYDTRRFHHPSSSSHYYANSRRTKSVDNLDSSESHRLYRRSDEEQRRFGSQTHLNSQEQQRLSRRDLHEVGRSASPFTRTQSVPLYKQQENKPRVIEHKIHIDNEDLAELTAQQQMENKKKKFKFQSTLRVLERKKIEAELSREAEEREKQRLREIEALRQVEEEFQRKRLQKQKKIEMEKQLKLNKMAGNNNNENSSWDDVHTNNIKNKFEPSSKNAKSTEKSSSASVITSSSHVRPKSSNSSGSGKHNNIHLTKRQEPEGAPSFSTTTDLRKELIHASRKRNAQNALANNGHGKQNGDEVTQELSEFRQETRQYCDYRRPLRTTSASPARYVESSSDIFPLSRRTPVERCKQSSRYRATVHPEIVCDIPVRPFPYMVNFSSRLSGSTSNLLVEERPGSGLGYGGGLTSGPPSVISENYRRDWAHHIRGSGSSVHGGGPGRASSIASLHSAPGYASDNLRHSVNDLSLQDSLSVVRTKKSPLFHKYSSSPPSSPMPPLSSSISEVTDHDKDGSSIITSANGPPSGIFQAQPFNKSKGYRPVAFRPPSSNLPVKLTSTTVK